MSEQSDDAASTGQAKAEVRAAEAAAIRRRWITLGEAVAVLAVLISGLTLWNSWSERSDSAASRVADARTASTRAATLLLVADRKDRGELTLKPSAEAQSVLGQTIAFPQTLGVAPVTTTSEPRVEAKWFERALIKAREAAKLPDDSRGDEQLPVAITTRFLADGVSHEDVALYDIGYTVAGRLFSGHEVTLRGLSLVARTTAGEASRRLDARWNALRAADAKGRASGD